MADKKEIKKFQMKLNLDSYEKLKIIAEKNQRSIVGQVAYWCYKNIEQYESENGKISSLIQQTNNMFANTEIKISGK